MTQDQRAHVYTLILNDHRNYWDVQQDELAKYKSMYEIRFWDHHTKFTDDTYETPFGKNYIEALVSQIFYKQPAVVVGGDPADPAVNPLPVETIANRWLFNKRTAFENATKLALIYPQSYLKLCVNTLTEDKTIPTNYYLEAVSLEALNPWEVIIDREANSWESMRFCGHIYQIPVTKAKELYGKKDWSPVQKDTYFDRDKLSAHIDLPEDYLFVEIVELYDLTINELIVFTTSTSGYQELKRLDIPYYTPEGTPLIPIVPLIFNWMPDKPLAGMSSMTNVYDAVRGLNNLRTQKYKAVQADVRKYLFNDEYINEENIDMVTGAVDAQFIPVKLKPGDGLSEIVYPLPTAPVGSNFDSFTAELMHDIDTASLLAPFTRGQNVTNTTATQINILNAYTNSEIGKMSRQKDECAESVAMRLIRIYYHLLGDEDAFTVAAQGQAFIVKRTDLNAKFSYTHVDQGSNPTTQIQQRLSLERLSPMLMQLAGAGAADYGSKLLNEIVRLNGFSDALKLEPRAVQQIQTPDVSEQPNQPTGVEHSDAAPPTNVSTNEGIY